MYPLPFAQLFWSERLIFPGFYHVGFFVRARTMCSEYKFFLLVLNFLTHLNEHIFCLCFAANRGEQNASHYILKIGNAKKWKQIPLLVYHLRQLLIRELATSATLRALSRFCLNPTSFVSCTWTLWTQGGWINVKLQIIAMPANFAYEHVMLLWKWISWICLKKKITGLLLQKRKVPR